MDIAALITKYGFPVVAAFGLMGLMWYVWTWVTREMKPVLSEANSTLIELVDRIRVHDNDLIRLNQKLDTYNAMQATKCSHCPNAIGRAVTSCDSQR